MLYIYIFIYNIVWYIFLYMKTKIYCQNVKYIESFLKKIKWPNFLKNFKKRQK